MARAQGARSQLAAAFETTYGTAPASGFHKIPFASASLGAQQPLLTSELLGYARSVEGYPDLVVHGPMQASFLLQFGARLARGRLLKSFSYRSHRPLFGNEPLVLNAQKANDLVRLWTSGASAAPAMQAELRFGRPCQEKPA